MKLKMNQIKIFNVVSRNYRGVREKVEKEVNEFLTKKRYRNKRF